MKVMKDGKMWISHPAPTFQGEKCGTIWKKEKNKIFKEMDDLIELDKEDE